jgi:hypothetical protein
MFAPRKAIGKSNLTGDKKGIGNGSVITPKRTLNSGGEEGKPTPN